MNKIFTQRKCLSKEEIISYLNDELSPGDLQSIENHLLECLLCSDALEGLKTNTDTLNLLPESMSFIGNDKASTVKEVSINKRGIWFSLAAAFLVILIATAIILPYIKKSFILNIYTEYFVPLPPTNSGLRGETTKADMPENKAMLHYGLNEYDKAIPIFETKLKINSNDHESLLYLGISYLETGQLTKAIVVFNKVILNSNEYNESATWYLALAHLKSGNKGLAKEVLQNLSKNHSEYGSKAKELLIRLDQ